MSFEQISTAAMKKWVCSSVHSSWRPRFLCNVLRLENLMDVCWLFSPNEGKMSSKECCSSKCFQTLDENLIIDIRREYDKQKTLDLQNAFLAKCIREEPTFGGNKRCFVRSHFVSGIQVCESSFRGFLGISKSCLSYPRNSIICGHLIFSRSI